MRTDAQRFEWALEVCRRAQMRLTPLRQAMLRFLAVSYTPVTLEAIAMADGVRDTCDCTTVYRTLMLFKSVELVRPVSTPGKASHFLLNLPGEFNHFLVCRRCGRIAELPLPANVTETIQQISVAYGFPAAPQDHAVHGLCAACAAAHAQETVPSKLKLS